MDGVSLTCSLIFKGVCQEPNRGLYLPLPTRVEIADQAEEMPLEAEDC